MSHPTQHVIRCKCCTATRMTKAVMLPVLQPGQRRELEVWVCAACDEPCTNGRCVGQPPRPAPAI